MVLSFYLHLFTVVGLKTNDAEPSKYMDPRFTEHKALVSANSQRVDPLGKRSGYLFSEK